MLVHWLWLANRPGLGDRAKLAVLEQFPDAEDAYYAKTYAPAEELTREGLEALGDKNLREAEAILAACQEKQIQILTYRDALYPARLKQIADAPLVLYYQGRMPEFDALPVISVVGTRQATAYGMTIAKRLGSEVARCGGLVVSGCAVGIDAMAMRGALSAGKPAVGILGCGVDVVYPAANRSLLLDTCRSGCLISEFPPETPPHKWNFPRRNRIISGLANGVVVVEAPARSGALITARQAAEQGRDVFVVPGNVDVAACAGSNALLRDGGIAVSTGWDILSEYQQLYPDKLRRDPLHSLQTVYPDEMESAREPQPRPAKVAQKRAIFRQKKKQTAENQKIPIDNVGNQPYIDLNERFSSLSPEERSVVECIGAADCLVDDLIARTGLNSGRLLSMLTMLEIRGFIARLPGKRVCLAKQKP